MKVFLVEFSGHYLPGSMIIVEETKRKAFNKAKKEIERMGLIEKNSEFSPSNLYEIENNESDLIMISDGDY